MTDVIHDREHKLILNAAAHIFLMCDGLLQT